MGTPPVMAQDDFQSKPDFVCFRKIIVELKDVKELTSEHEGQLLNDLKATGLRLGLPVNLGSRPNVEIERRMIGSMIFSVSFRAFRG